MANLLSKLRHRAGWLALAAWLVVAAASSVLAKGHYFEATWHLYPQWFPVFYLPAFLFFKTCYPLLYGLMVYKALCAYRPAKPVAAVAAALLHTAAVVLLQYKTHYPVVAVYGLLPAALLVLAHYKPKLTAPRFLNKPQPQLQALVSGSFLFVGYVVLCLLLPRFHPFAGYIMFNKFPEKTTVYLLRNKQGQLVPLEKYSHLKNDNLFVFKAFVELQHNHPNSPPVVNSTYNLCQQLAAQYRANRKQGTIPFDSLTIYEANFSLQQNKVVKDEFPLCTFSTH